MSQPKVNRAFLLKVSLIAGLGGILYGYDTGIIAAALVFVRESFPMSLWMQGVVVGIVPFGIMAGAILGGIISDSIGRRATLLWAGAIFVVGSLVAPLAPSVPVLLAARLLLGIAVGFTSVTAPVYVSELSPPQSRGMLIGLYQLALTLGIVLAYGIGYLFSAHHGWRIMFGLGALPAIVFFLLVIPVPESPRWLLANGRTAEAEKVLHSYTDEAGAKALVEDIRRGLASTGSASSWRVLVTPQFLRGWLIAGGFVALQQLCGLNAVIYYAPQIFSSAGVDSASHAILSALLLGVVNMVATVIALFLVDRLGRKPLIYVGASGMAASLLFLCYTFTRGHGVSHATGVTAIVCMMVYILCCAASLGPIAWILVGEVFPLRARSLGAASVTLTYGLSNTIISSVFPTVLQKAGIGGTFGIFAFFCLVTLLFTRIVIPETAGRDLESISA